MSAVKKIKQASLKILGCEAEPWDDVWKRIKELSKAFGEVEVVSAFEEWATLRQGEILTRPVAEFLKTATGQLRGIISLKENSKLKEFVCEISYLTDNEITFDRDQQAGIGKLLISYTKDEIKNALSEFYQSLQGDSFLLKSAPGKFVDKAEQFIYTQRKRKENAAQIEKQLAEVMTRERKKSEAELAAIPEFKEIEL